MRNRRKRAGGVSVCFCFLVLLTLGTAASAPAFRTYQGPLFDENGNKVGKVMMTFDQAGNLVDKAPSGTGLCGVNYDGEIYDFKVVVLLGVVQGWDEARDGQPRFKGEIKFAIRNQKIKNPGVVHGIGTFNSLDDNKVKGEIQFSNALGGGWFDFTAKRIEVR